MEACGRSRLSKEGATYVGEVGQVTMEGKRTFEEEGGA